MSNGTPVWCMLAEDNITIVESPHIKRQASGWYLYLSERVSSCLKINKADRNLLLIVENDCALIIRDPQLIERYKSQILEARQVYEKFRNTVNQPKDKELTSTLTHTAKGELQC